MKLVIFIRKIYSLLTSYFAFKNICVFDCFHSDNVFVAFLAEMEFIPQVNSSCQPVITRGMPGRNALG